MGCTDLLDELVLGGLGVEFLPGFDGGGELVLQSLEVGCRSLETLLYLECCFDGRHRDAFGVSARGQGEGESRENVREECRVQDRQAAWRAAAKGRRRAETRVNA